MSRQDRPRASPRAAHPPPVDCGHPLWSGVVVLRHAANPTSWRRAPKRYDVDVDATTALAIITPFVLCLLPHTSPQLTLSNKMNTFTRAAAAAAVAVATTGVCALDDMQLVSFPEELNTKWREMNDPVSQSAAHACSHHSLNAAPPQQRARTRTGLPHPRHTRSLTHRPPSCHTCTRSFSLLPLCAPAQVMGGQSHGNFTVFPKQYGLFQGEVLNVTFLHAPGFCQATMYPGIGKEFDLSAHAADITKSAFLLSFLSWFLLYWIGVVWLFGSHPNRCHSTGCTSTFWPPDLTL